VFVTEIVATYFNDGSSFSSRDSQYWGRYGANDNASLLELVVRP
jgi:hypothetical protein